MAREKEYPVTENPKVSPTHPGEILRDDVLPALDLTVVEAAKALRISISQLYRLIASGKLWAQPSGITREALHEYLRRPQSKLKPAMSRGKASRTATEEAQRLRDMLKTQRRPRGAI